MQEIKLGVQMMMVRDDVAKEGPYKVMKKLSDMGFKNVEISQIDLSEKNIEEFRKALDDFKMEAIAITAPLDVNDFNPDVPYLRKDLDFFVDICKRLDCNFIRIGMMPISIMNDKEGIVRLSKDMEEVAKKLEKEGIKLYYHNHHVEFAKLDGQLIIDMIRENAPTIGYELDVHWVHRGGMDVLDVINDFKGYVDLIHLKDYKVLPLDPKSLDFSDMSNFMNQFTANIRFAEVGAGNLNFEKIIAKGIESNVKYFIIEQDNTYGKDVYECLALSKKNLDKIAEKNNYKYI